MIEAILSLVGLVLTVTFGLIGVVLKLVFGVLGLVFSGVFWVALVAGTIFAVRAIGKPRARRDPAAARRTLDERYVRGEIDRDEYFERRALLR